MKKNVLAILTIAFFVRNLPAQSAVLEVYQIFQTKCVSCHDHASPDGNLDLEGTGATAALKAVNVANMLKNNLCDNPVAKGKGLKNIYPGRPDLSFLFKKINDSFESTIPGLIASEGDKMPGPNYPGGPLTEVEKEMIRQWIVFGAPNAGMPFDKQLVADFYGGKGLKSYPTGPPPGPAAGEGFQIKMGPFFMKPDSEVEFYQKWELSLPADVEVNRVDVNIANYSHHFIIYNWTDNATAASISPGLRTNSLHNDINLVAALQEATDLKLPQTTAFKWKKDIILDLNTHYINYSFDYVYQAEAYINVYTQPPGTALQEMYASLVPYLFTDPIPANGNEFKKLAPYIVNGLGNIHIWGLMGHTHKYGTSYKMWRRNANGTKGEQLYDAACGGGVPGCVSPIYDYQHIPMRYFEPLLPVNMTTGILHEATWENTGSTPVFWGATSDDEMMVMIAFWTLSPVVLDAQSAENEEVDVLVLPNPANDEAVFKFPWTGETRLFRLFDLAGREVFHQENLTANEHTVSTGNLPGGVYFWQAGGQAGKLIIEH